MSGFSPQWLALREAADARARDGGLAAALAGHLAGRGGELHVLDLGAGTGANLRWLAPRVPVRQRWRLLDDDRDVLGAAPRALLDWAAACGLRAVAGPGIVRLDPDVEARVERHDLARGLPGFGAGTLVTASALLDLVSRQWLERLVAVCAARRAPVLLALSYDGRIGCTPWHPDDARVRDAVNHHQLRDKGFGPALGPGAAAAAGTALRRSGYRVVQARSDWRLDARDAPLVRALLGGWAEAARECEPADGTAWIDAWLQHRLARADSPGFTLRVGHADLLAMPPA